MTFVASNGVIVHDLSDGIGFTLPDHASIGKFGINADKVNSLREFFQHERDEELGRWRSAEHPDYICNEHDGAIFVTDERDGRQLLMHRGDGIPSLPEYADVARAYFEAHPESKPWHDAKDNEVWALTINGKEEAAMLYRVGEFETTKGTYRVSASAITAGRRIWPDEES